MKTAIGFGFGFLLAFGATVVIGTIGPSPLAVWVLFLVVGWALASLPKLSSNSGKIAAIGLYAVPFLTLWSYSNPAPEDSATKLLARHALLLGCGVLCLLSLALFGSVYRQQPPVRKVLLALIPFFVCAWLIAFFSSSIGAGRHMLSFFEGVLKMDTSSSENIVLVLRKTIHFCFYGSLAYFACRFARTGGLRNAFAMALLLALCHASFDELRQSNYPDRTGSVWDVCLDMAGAATFLGIAGLRSRSKRVSVKSS